MNTTGIVSIIILLSLMTLIFFKKRSFFRPSILLLIGFWFFIANIDDVVLNFSNSPVGYSAQMVPSLIFLILGGLSFRATWLKSKREKTEVDLSQTIEKYEKIINSYGDYLAKNPTADQISDLSCLPFPKKQILEALILAHKSESNKQRKEQITIAAITLAYFQPDVGQEPLSALGFDLGSIDVNTVDLDDLAAQITSDVSKHTTSRYQELYKIVTAETKTILEKFE